MIGQGGSRKSFGFAIMVLKSANSVVDQPLRAKTNFDAVVRVLGSTGELLGGKHFASPKELKTIIAGRTGELTRYLTEKLLAYALCRELEGYDEIVVDR